MKKKLNAKQLILSILLSIPFIFSGIYKIISPGPFAFTLEHFIRIPHSLTIIISITLPIAEIIIGIFLLSQIYGKVIIRLYQLFLIVFIIFHIWLMFFSKLNIDCNCFGDLKYFSNNTILVLICILFVLSFFYHNNYDNINKIRIKNLPKIQIAFIVVTILLFTSFLYLRYSRIEMELSYGLLSNKNANFVDEQIKIIFNNYRFEHNKYRIVLLLKSPTCGDCMQQLIYWNAPRYTKNFSQISLFRDKSTTIENISILKKYYHLNFDLTTMPDEKFKQLVGFSSPFSVVLLLSKDNRLLDYAFTQEKEKLELFIRTVDDLY